MGRFRTRRLQGEEDLHRPISVWAGPLSLRPRPPRTLTRSQELPCKYAWWITNIFVTLFKLCSLVLIVFKFC